MKKTLIAMAVLAASGASFAQVTITGNLTMGYLSTTTGANAAQTNAVVGSGAATTAVVASDAAGLGVDTSQIDFNVAEDLGGGMKIAAKLGLAGADRSGESATVAGSSGNVVSGRDASLTLTPAAGHAIGLASARSADYLSGGVAGVGAYYQGFDGKIFSSRSNRDTATYTYSGIKDLTLAISYQEGANTQGLGGGSAGVPAGSYQQPLTAYVVNYATGPLTVNFNWLNYNSKVDNQELSTTGGVRDVFRLSGSYDFGVAKLGLGAQVGNRMSSAKQSDALVALSVPLGKTTASAMWGSRNSTDFVANPTATNGSALNGNQAATAFQLAYSMSKRTTLVGNFAQWQAAVGANNTNQWLLAVSHSF